MEFLSYISEPIILFCELPEWIWNQVPDARPKKIVLPLQRNIRVFILLQGSIFEGRGTWGSKIITLFKHSSD